MQIWELENEEKMVIQALITNGKVQGKRVIVV